MFVQYPNDYLNHSGDILDQSDNNLAYNKSISADLTCRIANCYSSLNLVQAFCEGSCESHQNKFSSFLTLHIVSHTRKASGICEKKIQNPWKSRHPFFLIQRAYGMQNNRLNFTGILAEKIAT